MRHPRHNRNGVGRESDSIKEIKLKIPSVQGKLDLETYLEWKRKIEMISDCRHYTKEQKVKLVVIELTDYAIV